MQVRELYSDQELIAALQNDDSTAFQTIFQLYWKDLYQTAYNRLRNQSEAEDLVQDIFTNIWERRHELEITSSLSGYLHQSIKFKMIRMLSRADLHKQALQHLLYRMTEMEATILDTLALSDVEQTLSQAIASFPTNMQKTFMLRSEDYSIREIAAALGIAEQTVKNNLHESVRRLRAILSKEHPDLSGSFYTILIAIFLKH